METVGLKERLKEKFAGQKVFITGHTGFKGTWMTLLLQKLGATVKGYALEPELEASIFNRVNAIEDNASVIADIRDKEKLQRELLSFQPDYIFHLAAQPLVRRSYEIPAETFEVNVIGTAHLLECLIHLKKKCTTVVITTDKVYANKEQHILYREEDRLGGYDPYSASKAATELVVDSFRNSFFNITNFATHQKAIASARAGNVIGGGDYSKDRIIPDIVRALQNNMPIEVRNPNAVRPWQHVLEPLIGYLHLAALLNEDIHFSGAYNFGPQPHDHLSVKEVVETAISIWGQGEWINSALVNQPHEAILLQLDISKAVNCLNWKPCLCADEAIKWTINWYKQAETDAQKINEKQIEDFLNYDNR
ncbi:MAG: CDP-glucose 4,6-dehydratase [Niabella sp.]|nr:MAG: CDP-glucose 4,6-dehydratase [Niabella sp.]